MTNSFIYKYYMPTRVFTGKDCIIHKSSMFRTLGNKALIVTGKHSAKRNGSEADVIKALDSVGIDYQVFDQVMSNPTISCVYEGAKMAQQNAVDFIIAIGGGSPMDAGKAIALLAAQDIAVENLFSGQYGNTALPMVLIPTTAGTGSEVTQYSIITNDKAQTKTSIASDLLFPTIAFLDEKYMEDLPVKITINTAIDAFSHAVEGILSVRASTISDALATESIQMIMRCLPELQKALQTGGNSRINADVREQLLQASCMAGMVIAQTGTTVVHSMGYSLTYFKDIDHGRANGLLLGEYLKMVEERQPYLAEKILKAMDLSSINSFEELINSLFVEKEDLNSEEIIQFSKIAIKAKNIANCIVRPTEDDIRTMFERSLGK